MSPGELEPQFGYDDHFTPARTGKKRKNRPPAESPSPAVLLERASEELTHTDWLRDTKQALRETLEEAFASNAGATPDILCLGLGSPSSSRDARAQLAFLHVACDDLRIPRTNVSVFDPVFTDQDHQLLTLLGLTELPENRMARYRIEAPTIAFMPHCDLHLYENLFRENWSKEQLPRLLLIANRLSEYAEKYVHPLPRVPSPRLSRSDPAPASGFPRTLPWHGMCHRFRSLCPRHLPFSPLTLPSAPGVVYSIPSRTLAVEYPCVARLAPRLTVRPLQPCAAFSTAFNNTAIQFVRASALADVETERDDWWTLPPPAAAATATATAPRDHRTTASGETNTRPVDKIQPGQHPPQPGSIGASPTSAPRSAKPSMETPSSS